MFYHSSSVHILLELHLFPLENLREVPFVVIWQMISERQRIEAPPSPSMDPPPSYEEVNGVFASPTPNGSTDSMGYFLGEVSVDKPELFLLNDCLRF